MTQSERRKIMCSVSFHVIAITCVVWSLWVLIERTAQEIHEGQLDWPFWTKLVVVAIGFTGGLVFMYVQCKVYVQLWKRLRAYNRIILVQNSSTGLDTAEYIWPRWFVQNRAPLSKTVILGGVWVFFTLINLADLHNYKILCAVQLFYFTCTLDICF